MKGSSIALFVTVLALYTTCVYTACPITFAVNPVLSQANLGGSIVKPVTAPLSNPNPGAKSGFIGQLVVNLPGECPADGNALATAISGQSLTSDSSTGPLQLYPSNITVKATTLATLNWIDVGFNTSITLPTQSTGSSNLDLTIADGYVLSQSLLSPTPDKVNITGVSGSGPATVTTTVNGNNVTVTITGFSIVLSSTYYSSLGGQPIVGVSNYTMSGTIVAHTIIGCPGGCGEHGKCIIPDGSTTAGCTCECGWSGAVCDIPSGFCPRYQDEAGGIATVCPTATLPPLTNDTSPACTPSSSSSSACTAWQQFNATTGSCQCKDGWSGAGCTACENNQACSGFYSSLAGSTVSSTCSTARVYSSNTALKTYTCDLTGTGLDDIMVPNTFYVSCNTTTSSVIGNNNSNNKTGSSNSSNGGGGGVSAAALSGSNVNVDEGSYCQVAFSLKDHANNPITCRSSLCSFQSNQSRVDCQTTSCSCKNDCPDLADVFKTIQGNPSVIDCDEKGVCVFDIKDFFVKLQAPCTNSECLVEGYVMQESAYADSSSDDTIDPFIAAIPLIVLVVIAAALTVYLFTQRDYFASSSTLSKLKNSSSNSNNNMMIHDGFKGDTTTNNNNANILAKMNTHRQIQPIHPVKELIFKDLTSIAKTPGRNNNGEKILLAGVSGIARKGELVGVLGPSGSGKTSLLSLLAGSAVDFGRHVRVGGSITLDGVPLDAESARQVAYCPQDTTLLSTLTVAECIRYSALLRLPNTTPSSDINSIISGVIVELGLSTVADSLVGGGSGIRGVSGGERRRVTIAMELVTNPAVLILDEPTSGLDSFTAFNLMTTLKDVAGSGRIVMLSFHQPSPAMFNLLDRTFLMAQGYCVYHGRPSDVDARFAALGLPRPAGTGSAEHMLHCACDDDALPVLIANRDSMVVMKGSDDVEMGDGNATASVVVADANGQSDAAVSTTTTTTNTTKMNGTVETTTTTTTTTNNTSTQQQSKPRSLPGRSLSRELAVMFWRTAIDIGRNPTLLLLHWGMALAMGVFCGCIFLRVGLDISGAQNRAGGLIFALAFFAFSSLTTVDLFMHERKLVAREARGGYYRPASYLLAKALLDGLLLRAVPVALFSAPFYPMMGLQSGSVNIALFFMTLMTFAVAVGALSLAVTVGCTTAGQASLIMNIVLLVSLLNSGFFVNVDSMPVWISWLHYLSVFFYGYAVLISNEMSSLLLNFVVEGYAAVQNVRGVTFLNIIGINPKDITRNIVILDCFYVAFLLLAFGLMYWRMPRAKKIRPLS